MLYHSLFNSAHPHDSRDRVCSLFYHCVHHSSCASTMIEGNHHSSLTGNDYHARCELVSSLPKPNNVCTLPQRMSCLVLGTSILSHIILVPSFEPNIISCRETSVSEPGQRASLNSCLIQKYQTIEPTKATCAMNDFPLDHPSPLDALPLVEFPAVGVAFAFAIGEDPVALVIGVS